MRSLYETGEYYVSLPPGASGGFEAEYWDQVSDPDGLRRSRLDEREQSLADERAELEFVRSLRPGTILDAGCGPGWFLSAVDTSWKRFGVERSYFAAVHAADVAAVQVAGIEACPFADEMFDLVVCHHVIEHVPDPLQACRELHRILKPDGRLLIATPDFDSGAARRFVSKYRLVHDPTHVSLFSNDSMHRFLRDNGFHVDGVEYPFFETRHFTEDALLRLFDTSKVSPPFYGSFMTFYCTKLSSATDPAPR